MKSAVLFLLGAVAAQREAAGDEPAAAPAEDYYDDQEECPWFYYGEGDDDVTELYGYDGCVLTGDEWFENPWEEEHTYYEFYDDLDLVCFYHSTEDYGTCYAFFRIDNSTWEFSEGGAWVW